jgi:hypothetical protein
MHQNNEIHEKKPKIKSLTDISVRFVSNDSHPNNKPIE